MFSALFSTLNREDAGLSLAGHLPCNGRGPQLNDAGPNEKRALPGASGRNHYSEVTVPLNLDERIIAESLIEPRG
jgi:hypothetical protein